MATWRTRIAVALRPGHRTPARGRRSALVHGDRRPFRAPLRRQPRDDGVRVSGRPAVDRQGVAAGTADEEEHRRGPGTGLLLSERSPLTSAARRTNTWHHEEAGGSRAHDDCRPGRPRSQPQEHFSRDSAEPADGRHRPLRLRQVESCVRHDLRRRPAAIHGVALQFRQALHCAGDQAGCRFRVWPVASDLHRTEDAGQQPAIDGRNDDRHRELPEPALRHDRPARTVRAPASRRRAVRRARFSNRSCRCRKARRSNCGRQCSRSTARIWTSCSPKSARKAAVECSSTARPIDLVGEDRASRRTDVRAHGGGCRSVYRRSQTREGDQGRHCGDAARGRRADAGPHRERGQQGGGPSVSTRSRAARRTTSSTATSARNTSCSTIPRARAERAAGLAWTS